MQNSDKLLSIIQILVYLLHTLHGCLSRTEFSIALGTIGPHFAQPRPPVYSVLRLLIKMLNKKTEKCGQFSKEQAGILTDSG